MAERINSTQRIRLQSRAEVEIMRYAKPDSSGIRSHALWHKHVHNVDLDAMQVLKMIEMDQYPNTIDNSCRRTRKTSTKELYNMEKMATSPALELGIVAPRQQQSMNNLNYMLEAIKRSPMLDNYIAFNRGRKRLNDSGFMFANGSKVTAYGIMGQIDGDSLAMASLEEVDDMPTDRLMSRFLPMLGASQRLGMDIKIEPEVRISGVFKGADVLQTLIKSSQYHLLPSVDVYVGLELGIIGQAWVDSMQAQQTASEWMRQFLCLNIASTNWIWEKYLHKAKMVGLAAGLAIAEPLPGKRYKRRGLISFGYDHLGHGESTRASRSCLVVTELIGNFVTTPRVRFWPADADEKDIERDLLAEWDYFRPDYAMGDAYGIGLMTSVNDSLFRLGLVEMDRMSVGDGKSSQSTWTEWAFSPIRFQGMTKHAMASAVRSVYHNGRAALPYFDEDDPHCKDWLDLVRHLGNIKEVKGGADYSSFKQVDDKIGDDGFDAYCAAVWALQCRGATDVATVIGSRVQTREQLMGMPARLAA